MQLDVFTPTDLGILPGDIVCTDYHTGPYRVLDVMEHDCFDVANRWNPDFVHRAPPGQCFSLKMERVGEKRRDPYWINELRRLPEGWFTTRWKASQEEPVRGDQVFVRGRGEWPEWAEERIVAMEAPE